jgi:hypothetical protein
MAINTSKTKAMRCSRKLDSRVNLSLQLGGNTIEWVEDFTYLGSLLTLDNNQTQRHQELNNNAQTDTLLLPHYSDRHLCQ